ncbi:replication-associated recombination protein A [Paraburkholderia sp. JPY432]|uniref:replication-associated recombination protein A n=1 Tax=Paraburkholderia youngii TaxID=2782701 RepID=UPI0015963570|nr:replication-associated recombination protein A [Paraburkholderia youngii]NVH73671.1 replication-associated recombination protein A [Paraburkholderia youngii]
MSDLFSRQPARPLAEKLRPQTIDDIVGQSHLLGEGRPLRLAFNARKLHSFILWGPPGVGKTTLGRLAATANDSEFSSISAVLAGVKEIRAAIEAAQRALDSHGRSTVLFVDEIHRFNKAQQDALLPHIESGLFLFVGSTTENPSFEVNSALLSRAHVYVLQPLSEEDFRQLYLRARQHIGAVTVDNDALKILSAYADGDARRFLNLLEQVSTAATGAGISVINSDFVLSASSPALRRFDKGGDEFYDQISALHKSIRGSQPDAALYWLARMLDGGADARYVARRLIRMASEEVGNADPKALQIAVNAAEAYERLGSPEGDLALAQAAAYIAVAAKSNAVYVAWNQARAFVKADGSKPVPMHLRNAPTELMAELGYHKGYRYAHDEPNAYAAGETYFPEGIPQRPDWYQPVNRGLESKIAEKLRWLRTLDEAPD